MTKKTLEEKFQEIMDEEFKLLFEESSVQDYVKDEFETLKSKLIFNYLGISRTWNDLEFTRDSRIKKLLDSSKLPVGEIISNLSLDDIEFTQKDIRELKASYKSIYIDKLEDLMRAHAHMMAVKKFDETIEKLGLEYWKEDENEEK